MELKPIAKARLSEAAVEQIKKLISNKGMKLGDKLPSERELVSKLQISRTSVREALRMLEIMGLVEIKPGKGAYIKELTSDLSIPLTSWISGHKESLRNFFEVRLALEPAAAGLAALRATSKDIRKLKENVTGFHEYLDREDLLGIIQSDIAFHRIIGAATRNKTMQLFTDTITSVLIDTWKAALRIKDRPKQTGREHSKILKAIMGGEKLKAQKAMERHLLNGLLNLKKHGLDKIYPLEKES